MSPRIEVFTENPRKVFASLDVDPAAPENAVNHIGIKLVELVQMGHMRNPERHTLEFHISYDGQRLNQATTQAE